MNSRQKQLIIAVLIFLGALFGLNYYIESVRQEYTGAKKVSGVVVASKMIQAGTLLRRDAVSLKTEVPAEFVPKAAIVGEDQLKDFIGQKVSADIPNGDYVLQSYFSVSESVSEKLSKLITSNEFRAVNLPVDETNSMARSILPNDHVDIIFSFQPGGAAMKMSTVLLQNVLVLSTGSYSASDRELGGDSDRVRRYNSLTLLLSAPDALRLTYARQSGQINLTLRKEGDVDMVSTPSITGVEDILSAEDKDRVAQAMLKRAQAAASAAPVDDKVRDQIRQMFEQRRSQPATNQPNK